MLTGSGAGCRTQTRGTPDARLGLGSPSRLAVGTWWLLTGSTPCREHPGYAVKRSPTDGPLLAADPIHSWTSRCT